VEWIGKEDVEIIFLYDSEASLRGVPKISKPFSHSVFEFGRLKRDTNGISIIPHPFTLGNTGAAKLGKDTLMRLSSKTDTLKLTMDPVSKS
jgi:hypothetical protein